VATVGASQERFTKVSQMQSDRAKLFKLQKTRGRSDEFV